MSTNHFNELNEGEQERLAILIEECSEVIQAGCKILRHGYDSDNDGELSETNRQQLVRELGDLLYALSRMEAYSDFNYVDIEHFRDCKRDRISKFLHHG